MASTTVTPTFTKPTDLPFDITQEQARIARKQKMIDALAEQSMQYRGNTEMAGNVAIKRSPLEALAQAMTGGVLGYADKNLAEKSDALPGKLNELNKSEMTRVQELMKTDPAAGMQAGAISSSPVVRALFEREMERDAEMKKMFAEKGSGAATNQSLVAAAQGGGVGALAPKAPKLEQLDPKQIAIDSETGARSNVIDNSVRQGMRKDGSTFNKLPSNMEVAAEAMKVSATAHANAAQQGNVEFAKKMADVTSDTFKQGYTEATKAVKTVQVLDNQLTAMQNGAYTGIAQPGIEVLSAVGEAVGVPVDKNKLAAGNQYQSAFATEIADYLTSGGGVGRSLTDADRKKLEQQYAQQWMTPEGQKAVIADLRQRANKSIGLHEARMQNLEKEYPDVAKMARITMTLPQGQAASASAASPVKPMTAAEFLKQRGR